MWMSPTKTIGARLTGVGPPRPVAPRARRRSPRTASSLPLRALRRELALAVLVGGATTSVAYELLAGSTASIALTGGAVVACLLLAAGAVVEIRGHQRRCARLATIEERARVARELHDGVAQELAHVLAHARRLEAHRPGAESQRLLGAAERALHESRAAISTLRAPLDEPLSEALHRVAGELGRRLGLDVRVDADPAVELEPEARRAVLRIVGEALSNAARHGGARSAAIELRDGAAPRLTISDDGRGFDPDPGRIPKGCFGLVSMRERAAALGGRLAVRSTPGAGTEIEVTLP